MNLKKSNDNSTLLGKVLYSKNPISICSANKDNQCLQLNRDSTKLAEEWRTYHSLFKLPISLVKNLISSMALISDKPC